MRQACLGHGYRTLSRIGLEGEKSQVLIIKQRLMPTRRWALFFAALCSFAAPIGGYYSTTWYARLHTVSLLDQGNPIHIISMLTTIQGNNYLSAVLYKELVWVQNLQCE